MVDQLGSAGAGRAETFELDGRHDSGVVAVAPERQCGRDGDGHNGGGRRHGEPPRPAPAGDRHDVAPGGRLVCR